MTRTKLTPHQQTLLDELIEASKSWGWHEDQGSGLSSSRAEANFNEAKQAMVDYLLQVKQG